MMFKVASFLKLSFLLAGICLIAACVKNDNLIKGDSKIRFFNYVGELSQDFYMSGIRRATTTGITYGNSTEYLIYEGDKEYNILAKNTGTTKISDSLKYKFDIGKNYSVFYSKASETDSLLRVYEDNLTPDTANSRLFFINLGYTLGSKVVIKDRTSLLATLANGENSGYVVLKPGINAKISLNLVDSASVIDTISHTNFYKGKTYTIIIDGVAKGANKGKLKERLIVNN
ncbi:hypothetical protein [Pedobacter jamesrossensis]|uniref:DUF4397 domain-containing protein n=1 Tax=Pedobacter jamesrossensis TaxID=1908238 RepID=A0ABV8NKG3_9SPHI